MNYNTQSWKIKINLSLLIINNWLHKQMWLRLKNNLCIIWFIFLKIVILTNIFKTIVNKLLLLWKI